MAPAMAPKAKRTAAEARALAEEEVAKMLQRARALTFRSQCNDIRQAMKSYPELAPSVISHLTSLGVDWTKVGCPQDAKKEMPLLAAAVGAAESGSDQGSMHDESTGSVKSRPEDYADESFMDAKNDALPGCYTEVRILSVRVMKAYLKMAEPVVFSDHAVRALAPMGKKVIPKQLMLEMWEFVFGQASDEAIAAAWHVPGAYAKHLSKLSESRGRLSRDLVLPPNWPRDGIYQLRAEGSTMYLESRLLKLEVPIPQKYLEEVDHATVHLQVNFSERSAIVADASGRLRRQASILMLEGQSLVNQGGSQSAGAVKEEPKTEPEMKKDPAAAEAVEPPLPSPDAEELTQAKSEAAQPPLPPALAALVSSTMANDTDGSQADGLQDKVKDEVKEEAKKNGTSEGLVVAAPKPKASSAKAKAPSAAKPKASSKPPAKRARVKG